jgi:hypothetical protein
MNHLTEPPQLVKVLIGITAVMAILLSGVTLGVLSNADTIPPISGNASGESSSSQEQKEGYTRPVLHLDSTDRREANLGATKPCQQACLVPCGQPDADAVTELCSPQPMQIDKQKLFVLLALWRLTS